MTEIDTFPKIIRENFKKYGHSKVAMRHKRFGIWKSITWTDFYQHIKYLSLGLRELGLESGDRVIIVGDNEPEWLFAAYGTQAAGAVFVGGYSESHANELKYYFENSGAKFAVVEDQEQVDKMIVLKEELPNLKKVAYWDQKGLWEFNDPHFISLEELEKLGRERDEAHPGEFEEKLEQGKGEDIAVIAYTSGTTGLPKGALLTHRGLIRNATKFLQVSPIYESDDLVSYIPLAWQGDFMTSINRMLIAGAILNFAEEPETVEQDIRELSAAEVLLSPKQLEARMKDVETRISRGTTAKKWYYKQLMRVGNKVANCKLDDRPVPFLLKVLYGIGYLLLFRPLKDKLGYLKTRIVYTAGATIAPETYDFYYATGVNLRCAYGITEAGGLVALHRESIVKDTVGVPLTDVEIRVSNIGEILVRTEGLFTGYHKNAEAYNKTVKDGWLYTGDNGLIGAGGHLVIYDRMSDMITLANGVKCSPQYMESRLRISPYVAEVMIVGDGKSYLTVMVIIDYNTVGRWAEEHHLTYTTFTDLSQKSEVYDLIHRELKHMNSEMAPAPSIKRFLLLHKQLDADDAELTRMRKLRRQYVEEHYAAELEALYGDKSEVLADADIVYRDGRTRKMTISIRIQTIE